MSCATSALTIASFANCLSWRFFPIMPSRILTASLVFRAFCSVFVISMFLRLLFKLALPLQRSLDINPWDCVLFCEAVRQHRHIAAMEEIEHAILHMALLGPKLINPIAQKVRRRSSQFVPELTQEHNLRAAVCPRFCVL